MFYGEVKRLGNFRYSEVGLQIPAVELQIKLSLSSNSSRKLWSMPKMFTHVLSTSRNHIPSWFSREELWGV